MFKVSDGRENRRRIVNRIAIQDAFLGVLTAAADFEWTCRRAILAMGVDPTAEIKFEMFDRQEYGLKLRKGWENKVKNKSKGICKFEDIFDVWAKQNLEKYVKWADIEYAMMWRNRLIHGVDGGIGTAEGLQCVNILECANDVLEGYLVSNKKSVYEPIRRNGSWGSKNLSKSRAHEKAKKMEIKLGKDMATRRNPGRDEIIIGGVRMLRSKMKLLAGVSAVKAREVFKMVKGLVGEMWY